MENKYRKPAFLAVFYDFEKFCTFSKLCISVPMGSKNTFYHANCRKFNPLQFTNLKLSAKINRFRNISKKPKKVQKFWGFSSLPKIPQGFFVG